MRNSNHLDRVTILLVGLSAVLLQIALDHRQPGVGVPLLAISAVLAAAIHLFHSRTGRQDWGIGPAIAVVLLGLATFPWEVASRSLVAMGTPHEVQLACVLRNMMLGLAALQSLPRARELATLASLFLVVVGFLWAINPWTVSLLVAYTAVGMWWLVGTYWELLGGRFADESEPFAPIRPALIAGVAIGLVTLAFASFAVRSSTTTALAGFFPSSGGTSWSDPFAHGGVGDGEQMVAAQENASSFGPVESELFLESQMPSLYDAYNEFSEAPPKNRKRNRRAIPLAASMTQMNHEKKGLTQKSTREFSTVRQSTKRRSNFDNHLSKALLLIKGRTPMHLALETFDHWDGHSLIAAKSSRPLDAELGDPDKYGRRWVGLSRPLPDEVFTTQMETQVRVINLRTKRVPVPPNTTSVTIDKLHAASMFSFASNGSLAMRVDHIPQLTILRLRSALRDRFAEPAIASSSIRSHSSVVSELASEWTAGVRRGWPQVNAVVDRLRTEYQHDQKAMVPDLADDAVKHFLIHAKRGPDYLFAASAAVLLQSLGYDTRVRSGLYASPERYDRASRLTTVLTEDVHFWVEVKSKQGFDATDNDKVCPEVWIAIEPTPGYDLLYAPESLLAMAQRWCWQALSSATAHPFSSLLSCLALGLLVVKRRPILDAALVGTWPVRAYLSGPRELIQFTLRLIEWRAWLYGRDRPTGTPLGRWDALQGQEDFLSAAYWALYGEGTTAPLSQHTIRDACRRVSRTSLNQTSSLASNA